MGMYVFTVFLLHFFVDLLLLMASTRLCGCRVKAIRAMLGAAVGGVYAGSCLLPGFHFLGNILWRMVSFALIPMVAYGFYRSTLRRGLIFTFLSLALEGMLGGIENGSFWSVLFAVGIVLFMFRLGFGGRMGGTNYIPVELRYRDTHLRITALRDTGNTLRDPITGGEVLVVGADVAKELTGLTREQLKTPVESMGALPGLRLIPYHTVGSRSFMLAMRLSDVKIGAWQGSTLVAFAPEGLSREGAYQALTGGIA